MIAAERLSAEDLKTIRTWPIEHIAGNGARHPAFNERTIRKGFAAETIVLRYLQAIPDCVVEYQASPVHEIDFFVTEDARTMPYTYLLDVKGSQEKREFEAYGFNSLQLKKYQAIRRKTGMETQVWWVDYRSGVCVGNDLSILEQHHVVRNIKYPHTVQVCSASVAREVTYFPREFVKTIFELTPTEIGILKEFS